MVDDGKGDTVELIEIAYSGTPAREVTLRGIQLTYRPIDEVVADLRAAGHAGRTSTDDERIVVEGVSVAAPNYFGR